MVLAAGLFEIIMKIKNYARLAWPMLLRDNLFATCQGVESDWDFLLSACRFRFAKMLNELMLSKYILYSANQATTPNLMLNNHFMNEHIYELYICKSKVKTMLLNILISRSLLLRRSAAQWSYVLRT